MEREWFRYGCACVLAFSLVLPGLSTRAQSDTPTALATKLDGPSGLALSERGDLYISDSRQHRVLRVTAAGIVSVVAGTGKDGYSGDGGPAHLARLDTPTGLIVRRDGALYVADTNNHVVRRVGVDGVIATVAGNGKKGFAGDGGAATSARLAHPVDVESSTDGILYIADGGGIRTVSPSGTMQTVSKLTGLALAIDHLNNLYISQSRKVVKLTGSGAVEVVAGSDYLGGDGDGRKATSARLSNALGLAVDTEGNLYISDQNNLRIRKVSTDGLISTVVGDATYSAIHNAYIPKLYAWPTALAVDKAGNIYYASGGEAVKDYAVPQAYSPSLGAYQANSAHTIAQTVSDIARGVVYGKDATYLPWNGARFIFRKSVDGVASPVVGKLR